MTQNSSKDPHRFQGEAADRPNENTSVSAAADNAADNPKAPVHQRRKPAEDAGLSAAQKTSRPIGRGYFRPAQKTAAQLRDERNERVIYDILAKFDKKENEAQSSGQSEKTAQNTNTAAAANTAENADPRTAGRRGKGGNRPENGRTKGKEKTAAKKPESGMHAAGRSGRSAAEAADSAKETAKGGRGETADEVEHDEAKPPHAVLDVVAEDPQVQHVAEQVQPAAVQELAREQRRDLL